MPKRPPQDFLPVVKFLNVQGIIPQIVAGQAVNLWALRYVKWDADFSPLLLKLTQLHPFTSDDLEILAGARAVLRKHPNFEVEDGKSSPFGKAWAPDEATLYFRTDSHDRLKIQSMRVINGVPNEEIIKRQIEMKVEGARFYVPDPITVLKGKISNLDTLPQKDRQDAKHVKIMVRCIRAFIGEDVQDGVEGRPILNLIMRLHDVLDSSLAKRVSANHLIDFSDTLPIDILSKSSDPKLRDFVSHGYPRMSVFHPNPKIKRLEAEVAASKNVSPSDGLPVIPGFAEAAEAAPKSAPDLPPPADPLPDI